MPSMDTEAPETFDQHSDSKNSKFQKDVLMQFYKDNWCALRGSARKRLRADTGLFLQNSNVGMEKSFLKTKNLLRNRETE